MHNDSGDAARVYAVSRLGVLLGTYTLSNVRATDWEDMAIGPAPGGGSYLYLADIGDNFAQRRSVRVYRVLEPEVRASQRDVRQTLGGVTTFDFTYPDGARDAEAFMVDPLTGAFYIVSKRELDGNRLYLSMGPVPGLMNTLTRVGTFSFSWTTGADISPDGLQVLIRRYSNRQVNIMTPPGLAGSYWRRTSASTSLVTLLAQPGEIVPLVTETQGEAIAFAADGRGFYTTSERGDSSSAPPLTFYAALPD
jgi:hypothetical protein